MAIITVTPILSDGSKLNPSTISFSDTQLVNLRGSSGLLRNPPGALSEVTFRNATNPGQNTIVFVLESVAAIQAQSGGGALSPLQPLPLGPVATFPLLPPPGNEGDIIFVTDASGDPLVAVGGAQYTVVGGAWVISGREIPTSADGQVANIAARNALTPLIGQTTNVVDASADPAITAGEATYIWDGNSWITIDPLPTGLVYVADATIAARDARTAANGDFSYVADASADPLIAAGPAFYQFVNGAWVLDQNRRYNDYATYADIATRDAATGVFDGDVAFVTDASADPAITAGSAYYVRVNGLWVLQLNASGLSYVAYATIAARDAATVVDGDFAEVTDASADPNVAAGTAFYQRRSGAWVRIEGRSFEYVNDATIAARDARVNVENGDVSFVTDASADPLITSGSATYIRSNGVWVLQENTRFNDYAVYANIAARDAATGVLDGDWAQVTDASADVNITAGAAIYQRVGGAWVLRFNGSGLQYAAYATIALRDAATVNNGDIAFVTDASADPTVISGSAVYDRVEAAWVKRIDTRFNDYAAYATIAARDADAAVLDGDVAFVTDASADPAITAGSAYYVRVNGLWVLQLNTSGLSYVTYATVAARDAATVIDGDFAEVTDASADPNITSGVAFYQRRSGAWVRIEGRSFEYATDATIAARDARVNVENGDVAFVTDASADPAITAGPATYDRVNGAWVLRGTVTLSNRTLITQTTLVANTVDPANPTQSEIANIINTVMAPAVNNSLYFINGTDLPGTLATFVFSLDNAGNITRVQEPAVATLPNRTFISATTVIANAVDPANPTQAEIANIINTVMAPAVPNSLYYYTGSNIPSDETFRAYWVDNAGSITRIEAALLPFVAFTPTNVDAFNVSAATVSVTNSTNGVEHTDANLIGSLATLTTIDTIDGTLVTEGAVRSINFTNSRTVPVALDLSSFPPFIDGTLITAPVTLAVGERAYARIVVLDGASRTIFFSHQAKLGGLTVQAEQAANFTATAGSEYPVDSTLAARVVTAPGLPVAGDEFAVFDSRSQAFVNNITVNFTATARPYNGAADNAVLAVSKDYAKFKYIDGVIGWRLER